MPQWLLASHAGARRRSGRSPLSGDRRRACVERTYLADNTAGMAKPLPAGFIIPARPIRASKPPSGPDWVHEIKPRRLSADRADGGKCMPSTKGPSAYAASRLRLCARRQGAGHAGDSAIPRAPVDHEHCGLYGLSPESIPRFLARLSGRLALIWDRRRRPAALASQLADPNNQASSR